MRWSQNDGAKDIHTRSLYQVRSHYKIKSIRRDAFDSSALNTVSDGISCFEGDRLPRSVFARMKVCAELRGVLLLSRNVFSLDTQGKISARVFVSQI